MSEDIRIKIAFAVGLIIFIKGYIDLFRTKKSSKEKFMEKAKERGDFVEAKAVDSIISGVVRDAEMQSNRTPTYVVTYEYYVNEKRYTKKLYFQSPGMAGCDYPSKITVYYDRNNPKKAYSKNDVNETVKKNASCFGTILKGFIIMFLIFHGLSLL